MWAILLRWISGGRAPVVGLGARGETLGLRDPQGMQRDKPQLVRRLSPTSLGAY